MHQFPIHNYLLDDSFCETTFFYAEKYITDRYACISSYDCFEAFTYIGDRPGTVFKVKVGILPSRTSPPHTAISIPAPGRAPVPI